MVVFTRSWEDISHTYGRYSNNRPYLNPNKQLVELAQNWVGNATEEQDKVTRIYESVKQNFIWNDRFSTSSAQKIDKLLELQIGSSADLNYLLLATLRAAGLQAYPVLISTRQNGYLILSRPSLSQFNHMIVLVGLEDGSTFFLDATKRDIPTDLLPAFDLVDQGRLFTTDGSTWIDILPPASEKTAVQLKLSLTKAGQLSGQAGVKSTDYAALELRRAVENESDMAAYLQKWLQLESREVQVENFADPYQDVDVQAQVDASNYLTQQGEFYYVQAIIAKRFTENPFKAENRVLPIDLVKPQEFVYVMSLELEEGLRLEELPESISFTLPEGKAKYSLRFVDLNGSIQVIEKHTIKEPFFSAEEYAALKNFLDLVVEKQQATLVIKGE